MMMVGKIEKREKKERRGESPRVDSARIAQCRAFSIFFIVPPTTLFLLFFPFARISRAAQSAVLTTVEKKGCRDEKDDDGEDESDDDGDLCGEKTLLFQSKEKKFCSIRSAMR